LLDAERARFRELFEIAPEGLIQTDVHGTIRDANRGAAAMLNLPVDYLVGKPLAVFVDPEERRAFRIRVYRARMEAAEEAWTVKIQPRDAEPIRAFVAVSPMMEASGSTTGLRWLVRDISKRRAAAIWERTPAAILRSAIDAMSSHVVVMDSDGTIVTTNRAWRDAIRPAGLFRASSSGSSYMALCDAAIREGSADALRVRQTVMSVLRGEPNAETTYSDAAREGDVSDSDADHQWFALRATRCDGPEPSMVVITHENITASRRAQARETALIMERSARTAAEAANRAKSEFLATLSHELRTPLNAIAGYAQLLEMGVRGPVNVAQAEDLRRILRSEQHLLGLINELLSFARVERGEVNMELTRVDVTPLTQAVIELVEPQATKKGLSLEVSCEGDVTALADADRMRQILLNLMTNAVKFTPPGGVIRVVCLADDMSVRIAVHDTGIGIPPSKQEEVFDPFVQIDRGAGSSSEGIGLGLAISRGLARAMGGEISVQSEPGKGSTFELSLSRGIGSAALS